jgi:hypothetical protein
MEQSIPYAKMLIYCDELDRLFLLRRAERIAAVAGGSKEESYKI